MYTKIELRIINKNVVLLSYGLRDNYLHNIIAFSYIRR